MAYFDTLEANNRSDKGPSQNPFNYIKSTRGGKATNTKKFLKFNNEGAGIFKTRGGRAVNGPEEGCLQAVLKSYARLRS